MVYIIYNLVRLTLVYGDLVGGMQNEEESVIAATIR